MSKTNLRRRFQFSLKRLFIVITLIASLFGAWVLSPGERQRRVVQRIQRLGGTVSYETAELQESPLLFPTLVARTCLPRDYFDPVLGVNLFDTPAGDADLQSFGVLSNLQGLSLNKTLVTDTGLIHLHGNKELVLLFVDDTKITEQGVAELKKAIPNCDVRRESGAE